MKKITEELLLLLILLIIIPFSSVYAQWDPEGSEEAILVGRLSHIEGTVSQYLPDEDQWISAEEDAPFGKDDILQSGRDGRAELVIPNNTWIRLDNDTQMHIVSLQADRTHVAIDAGTVRFYNKGSNAIIRVATPFGSVSASSRSSFDIYVDDASVEVIALKGRVSFVHTPDQEEYEVMAGSTSLLAERHRITAGKGTLARDWEIWNNRRDNLWRMRAQEDGRSRDYLPPPLSDESYVLDSYGRWVRVYYDGAYRTLWRPVRIGIGWAPFTVGTWIMWHGDYCWIPEEPFGYLTHHYGNWVLVNNLWYWAPPATGISIGFGSPSLHIGFTWYPGRVGWVRSGPSIGWVPLAPYEPYYCRHRWGPRVIVVKNVRAKTIIVKERRYRYARHTLIVRDRNHLRIHRKKKTGAFATRKRLTAPSQKTLRGKPWKKQEPKRRIDRKQKYEPRRTLVAREHKTTSNLRKKHLRHANLKTLPKPHAAYPKLASAGSTAHHPAKRRALRKKREAPAPKLVRNRNKTKRTKLPVRQQRTFGRQKQQHKVEQALQVPQFRSRREKAKHEWRQVKKQPRRVKVHPVGRFKARAEFEDQRMAPLRFVQREQHHQRSSARMPVWQR